MANTTIQTNVILIAKVNLRVAVRACPAAFTSAFIGRGACLCASAIHTWIICAQVNVQLTFWPSESDITVTTKNKEKFIS